MSKEEFDSPEVIDFDQLKKELECRKLELEQEKILLDKRKAELDIADLEKVWFKKPAYLTLIISILTAGVTAAILYYNGLFGERKAILELQTAELKIEKVKFEDSVNRFQVKIDSFVSRIKYYSKKAEEDSARAAYFNRLQKESSLNLNLTIRNLTQENEKKAQTISSYVDSVKLYKHYLGESDAEMKMYRRKFVRADSLHRDCIKSKQGDM